MSTASLNKTSQSLLTTVSETANALTGIVTSVSSSVEILNNYVARHRQMQASKNRIELHDYKARLVEDTTRSITERKIALDQFLGSDQKLIEQFNATYAELSALIA